MIISFDDIKLNHWSFLLITKMSLQVMVELRLHLVLQFLDILRGEFGRVNFSTARANDSNPTSMASHHNGDKIRGDFLHFLQQMSTQERWQQVFFFLP